MATRPTLRLLWQRPLGRLALLAFLLAAAAAWYVTASGGWVNALHLPPVLDASTPRSQNGFTLLDVQLPGQQYDRNGRVFAGFQYEDVDYQSSYGTEAVDRADAFGLWLKPPPDSLMNGNEMDSAVSTFGKALSVTARLSTGEIIPLDWHLRNQGDWLPPGEAAKRLVFITLPSGYSDACRFVDFTISDQSGHSAHWRVAHLPRMRHAVPPPSSFTDTIITDNITVSARAWHGGTGPPAGSIGYILHPILPPGSHHWDVLMTKEAREWEPFSYDEHVKIYADSGVPILGRNGLFNTDFERWYGGGILGYVATDYYPRMTRFLRLTCELRQFETYDEMVTFHNVAVQYDEDEYRLEHEKIYHLELPRSLTVTTPSGVTVTLPAQGGRFRPSLFGGALNFFATIRPKIQNDPVAYSLPNSPLARTFGKPVKISLTFPPPYQRGSWSAEQDGVPASYSMSLPTNPAWHPTRRGISTVPMHEDLLPILKDFTVIIRQRVDLQVIPMTFTLPITAEAPAYYPKGYQMPRPKGYRPSKRP